MQKVVNINVGVLGHVDSGKTSLVAALSDVLSVAALDKHPQSRERGITLDIGLSAFQLQGLQDLLASRNSTLKLSLGPVGSQMPCPEDLKERFAAETLQFTLVDCPGHASLLKTVLVGAQIIDMMLLVIDATKGIQTQTAECIIVGELLSQCAVVALNKTDLFPPERRGKESRRSGRRIVEALQLTRFAAAEIVPVAAKISSGSTVATSTTEASAEPSEQESATSTGAPKDTQNGAADSPSNNESVMRAAHELGSSIGIDDLKQALLKNVPKLQRETKRPFLFMADHCFQIKGHGTVLSGTVLQGSVATGDNVEIGAGRIQRKVKSLQRFREPCKRISCGDRAGLCVTKFAAAGVERTWVSAPKLLRTFQACVCLVQRCRFYTAPIPSRQKVFITIGHQTTMARTLFFGLLEHSEHACSQAQLAQAMFTHVGKFTSQSLDFDLAQEYLYQPELYGIAGRPRMSLDPANAGADVPPAETPPHYGLEWVLLIFDKPVTSLPGSVMISSKLDLDMEHAGTACRISFYGNVCHIFEGEEDRLKLNLIRWKFRKGKVERLDASGHAIVKDMFKKDSDLSLFLGNEVLAPCGTVGKIIASFGKSGKVRVDFGHGHSVWGGNLVVMRTKKAVPTKL